VGAVRLSILQFAICGLLSGGAALSFESLDPHGIIEGIWPILYGGILSVGVAYTLQVVAQRHADPAHAAIILSLEGAFAALGGWLVLNELLTLRDLVGCGLMFAGMLISQILGKRLKSETKDGEL
jgi:drug/metabolite transporter (DMT)-like permease